MKQSDKEKKQAELTARLLKCLETKPDGETRTGAA